MKTTLCIENRETEVNFTPATVIEAGEYAGNVECDVTIDRPVPSEMFIRHLRMHVPGELTLMEPTGCRVIPGGYRLTFFSAEISNSGNMPLAVEMVWESGDEQRPLGELPFQRAPASFLKEKSEDAHLPS